MKTALLATSTVSAMLLLAACETETKPPVPPPVPPAQSGASPAPSPSPEASPSPAPEASPTPAEANPSPTPEATPATTGNIPFGIPVPGKPGFVVSPYSPNSGYVDVRGFAPNSEVKDPYSGKTFLVP
ncbi:MAG TPA: hypothetical protein VIM61_01905 [Chthoniobacterales bacterium]